VARWRRTHPETRRELAGRLPKGRIPRSWPRALADPVAGVLLLAGIGDAASGNPLDALLLFGVAASLVWWRRSGGVERPAAAVAGGGAAVFPVRRISARVAVLGATAFALAVGGFPRYSWPLTFAVLVPGALGLVHAWRQPLSGDAGPRLARIGVAVWLALLVGLGLWELTNLLLQPTLTTDSWAHPTLSVLLGPILDAWWGRTLGLFSWILLGWWLAER